MSDIKLQLPDKSTEETPVEYVNNKLVPLLAELQNRVNALVCPTGESEGLLDIDMIPQEIAKQYHNINTFLSTVHSKSCRFMVPKGTKMNDGEKTAKILFSSTVYSEKGKTVAFRLTNLTTGVPVNNSVFQISSSVPFTHTMYLPVGDQTDRIHERECEYGIQAKYISEWDRPICRRFSLAMVYA